MHKVLNQTGQSLVEVIIALSVSVIIIIALTSATTNAVRNAQFAKNQNLATKLAQEGVEIVRAVRDQNGNIYVPRGGLITMGSRISWSDLWLSQLSADGGYCYLLIPKDSVGSYPDFFYPSLAQRATCTDPDDETLNTIFRRKIKISDAAKSGEPADVYKRRKLVEVEVYWKDSQGKHSARHSTYLTNWQ